MNNLKLTIEAKISVDKTEKILHELGVSTFAGHNTNGFAQLVRLAEIRCNSIACFGDFESDFEYIANYFECTENELKNEFQKVDEMIRTHELEVQENAGTLYLFNELAKHYYKSNDATKNALLCFVEKLGDKANFETLDNEVNEYIDYLITEKK